MFNGNQYIHAFVQELEASTKEEGTEEVLSEERSLPKDNILLEERSLPEESIFPEDNKSKSKYEKLNETDLKLI